ncbi:HEAT repeat domain-containing protein [Paenibacillus gansuensis]|uniref:HEAT repeat domain-containing protein n=1 Tax=Paenibacillus gansuensis TaxID=306542 RepID=A0ABW5P8L1_9BACL
MAHTEMKNELPEHYEQLKKNANRMSSWRDRLAAVEELGQYNHPKTVDVLTNRLANDPVFTVQQAAYRKLKDLGQQVGQPVRKQGDLLPGGVTKTLVRIKKSLPHGHTYEEFKDKLRKMRIDLYDTYEGDKGDEFESWLEEKWASLTWGRK